MPVARTVRQLSRLSREQWVALWQAQLLLPRVSRRLRRHGLKSTLAWVQASHSEIEGRGSADLETLRALAFAVNASCRRGPFRGACLERSLVLSRILHRRGIPHQVVIGADWKDRNLQAHAWVEWEGEVVNDAPDVRERFGVLERGEAG